MKIIKLASLALVALSFGSCLKTANDFAGLRTDNGQVVTSIMEKQYLVSDGHNIGFGWDLFAGFNFATPATEPVRFLTLHVSQPKTKISGSMTVKIGMTANSLGTLPPAGAITIADVVIPENSAEGFDVPVRYTVNKAALNPATAYAATFTITSVSQGIASSLESSLDVKFQNSRYTARYNLVSTIKDPAGQYGVTNNSKYIVLNEGTGANANTITIEDQALAAFGVAASSYTAIQAANLATGAASYLITPRYVLDAAGKVTAVFNGATNVNATIDPSSQFAYNANDDRVFTLSYTFSYTTTINTVPTTRLISVVEKYTWAAPQARY